MCSGDRGEGEAEAALAGVEHEVDPGDERGSGLFGLGGDLDRVTVLGRRPRK